MPIGHGLRRDTGWRPAFDRHHHRIVAAALAAALACAVIAPGSLSPGPAPLLVASALIGIPHGSSDFVVAHDLMAPRLRSWWLPSFLAGYLLVAGLVIVAWRFAPAATLVGFLAVAACHFGAGQWDGEHPILSALHAIARALTPTLPIFLLHSTAVAGVLGLMSGHPAATVAALLDDVRSAILPLYVGLLVVLTSTSGLGDHTSGSRREAAELLLTAGAAWLLPPFVTFTLYFCGLHAVRHMADLGSARHPDDAHAAVRLSLSIIAPSAALCCLVLAFAWKPLGGSLPGLPLLSAALQFIAALTLPHVMLEGWAALAAEQNAFCAAGGAPFR